MIAALCPLLILAYLLSLLPPLIVAYLLALLALGRVVRLLSRSFELSKLSPRNVPCKNQHPHRNFHWQYPVRLRSQNLYLRRSLLQERYRHNLFGLTAQLGSHDITRRRCHVALHNQHAFHSGIEESHKFPLVWDSGASISVTHDPDDFPEGVAMADTPATLQGLAAGLQVAGRGIVHWNVLDANGQLRAIKTRALLVPKCSQRLLSPQAYLQDLREQQPGISHQVTLTNSQLLLHDPSGALFAIPLDQRTNLPMCTAYRAQGVLKCLEELNLCVTDAKNQNLSESQKELLRWHFRLGHVRFESIQLLLRSGALALSEGMKGLHRAASRGDIPRCASCQFGKAKSKSAPGKPRPVDPSNDGALRKEQLLPGQRVSVDHFVGGQKGRLYTSKGKTESGKMYAGGAIFVDNASSFIHVEHQIALTSHETLQAKHKFEATCRDMGVVIHTYHTDNGTAFNNREFAEELKTFRQVHSFAGVGAHHQNGVAERGIQTIMSMARTMMLHSAIKWPDTCDLTLWPMAVDYAVYIHNHVPHPRTGLSPIDIFSQSKWPLSKCHDLHVWGSPLYVLDPSLQDGKKIPRWNPRSRRGKFLGLSRNHASSIPLALNLDTGHISPQYHCVFDDWYSTVAGNIDAGPDLDSPEWQELFAGSRFQYPFDDDCAPSLGPEWTMDHHEVEQSRLRQEATRAAQDDAHRDRADDSLQTKQVPDSYHHTSPISHHPITATPPERAQLPPDMPETDEGAPSPMPAPNLIHEPTPPQLPSPRRVSFGHGPGPSEREVMPEQEQQRTKSRKAKPSNPEHDTSGLRRSSRSNKGVRFLFQSFIAGLHTPVDCRSTPFSSNSTESHIQSIFSTVNHDVAHTDFSGFLATSSDPDTLRYDEAMSAPDSEGFRTAMKGEIDSLVQQRTWVMTTRDEAHKAGKPILPGTWTFKRKRTPEGAIKKLKARYCVRGDLQGPVSNTFAPVVMWSTVRLLLFFVLSLGLKTRCIDFSNAFVQAKLTDPIYIHLPRGFHSSSGNGNSCLRLEKSLYGIAQAPRLWFDHLKDKLLRNGFRQSILDPCLFYSRDIVLVCYVDDIIMASKHQDKLDRLVKALAETSDLTDEGELETFLGIKVVRGNEGATFTLSQPLLTERIIAATGMEDANCRLTPAAQTTLGKDIDGPEMTEDWNYASVVGMLMYLSNNSRPDIAFAVHQCARFTHFPNQSHAVAVKSIVRYLIGTRTQGLVLQPTTDLSINCFVDADFAGLFGSEDDQDPSCAKSRTGYIIYVGGCPLTWGSKLQTEIALSTCEAEYVALASALREVIYLRLIVAEMGKQLGMDDHLKVQAHSTVFEDNNGALALASTPKLTSRSRHYAVKYHFFRSHVASGAIQLKKVDTKDQVADIFTKSPSVEIFQRLRLKLCGW
jgi:Reverse transcriptase (RNA-dependent DNA polymerase)/GAG-pre-integrase domain